MAYKSKEAEKAQHKRYYEANKDKAKAWAKVNRDKANLKKKEFVKNYLLSHACVDCGESDPIVLEFDHVRGIKLSDIADMKWSYASIQKIQDEMAKCDVRCANCHRRITYSRQHT